MISSRRPALGARAVSDMAPLTATPFDSLAGTRAIVGGHNVIAGSQLSKGGRAPESPFLSLPPALSAEAMQRLIDELPSQSTPRTPSTTAQAANARSSMMVRSYSMPVPTEKEFALQRSMYSAQRQTQSAWANGWTPSSGGITEARRESAPPERSFGMERQASTSLAMASTVSSPTRKRRSSAGSQSQRQTYNEQQQLSRSPPSPRSPSSSLGQSNQENCPPASPYSVYALLPHLEGEKESYFSYRKPSSDDDDDMSDDEALTPRAGSPLMLCASLQSKCSVDVTIDDIFQDIHPDHLAPPRAMLFA